jgi:hypothetical protein
MEVAVQSHNWLDEIYFHAGGNFNELSPYPGMRVLAIEIQAIQLSP